MAVSLFARGRRETKEGGAYLSLPRGNWQPRRLPISRNQSKRLHLFHNKVSLDSTRSNAQSFHSPSVKVAFPGKVVVRKHSMRGTRDGPSPIGFERNSNKAVGVRQSYGRLIAWPSSRLAINCTRLDGVFWETKRTAPSHMTNWVPPG